MVRKSTAGEKPQAKPKVCFVIGPIGSDESDTRIHADWVLEGIIVPVMQKFSGFEVIRADQEPPGMITNQIVKRLRESELVIADLTHSNPNVFYEVGIRHVWEKPIIHMQLLDHQVPFDVGAYRTVKFSLKRYSDLVRAQERLASHVKAVLSQGHTSTNPVTQALHEMQQQRDQSDSHPKPTLNVSEREPQILVQLSGADDRVLGIVRELLRSTPGVLSTKSSENSQGLVVHATAAPGTRLSQLVATLKHYAGVQDVLVREY